MIKSKYLIIDIIPLIRLPSNAPDFFSYFSEKKIKRGAIVEVEFKKRKIPGYVFNLESIEKRRALLKEKKLQLKPVLKIINPSPLLTKQQLQLAFWLKNYSNISLATALSLFFPYKKMMATDLRRSNTDQRGLNKKFEIEVLSQLNENILKNKKSLIIVPQENYLEYLKQILPQANLILPQQKSFFSLLEKITSTNQETFIGNKNSIFLPWQNLDQLIVYDEGSFFYKEFFKPPYFDYRKIFLKFAEINKIKYLAISDLPSFDLLIYESTQIKKQINMNKSQQFNLGYVRGNSYNNSRQFVVIERISEKEFEDKIKEFKKIVIFVPEKTFGYRLICESCLQTLTCNICGKFLAAEENFIYCSYCLKNQNLPEICPFCKKKSSFLISHKGAKAIYKLIKTITNAELSGTNAELTENNDFDKKKNIYFLEKESKKIIKEFNQEERYILIGSLLLLNPLIENFDAFFFYNFDEFYFAQDFFVKEKFIRILNFFKNKTEKIFLVGNIINPRVEAKIKTGEIINELIKEREINSLPPFRRLVILKEGGIDLKKLQEKLFFIKERLKKENPEIEIFGPIFARPFKIRKRFFLELIIKTKPKLDFNLKKLLEGIEIEEIDCDALSY
ncbi:MAG: hypothetical protein KatS3mg096_156 [Candidatus Parcubacteria bacterium]|nr:MAG: hypothetical protein KatS3mg096_156 [Candidatus Parcubacteria bacterium]